MEASLHLCPNLQVFSLDVHLYLNFLVFIGTVVLPDSVQFSLLTQSCPTLCDPMDCSMPGLPVQHQLTGLGAPILQYGLPWSLSDKESTCQCRRCGFDPRVGKVPWRRKWQSTPIFLPGKSHGQRSLAGYSPQGHEESDTMEATKQQQKSMNSHGALQWLVISISVLCLVGQSVRLFVTP